MNLSEPFIRRPVMTTLVMVAFLISGMFGYFTLPVSELPTIDYPTIQVTASLPGADADTMASSVATPLENRFSGIAGIDSMTSESQSGFSKITLQFRLDRNIDAAAQDVQSALSAASRQMPKEMTSPPTLNKQNPSDQPFMFITFSSTTMPLPAVDEYMETFVARRLSTVDGVAQVQIWGAQKPAIRVQLDPDALAVRGIGVDQVSAAIQQANVNQATGSLDGLTRTSVIRTQGQLFDAEAFGRQIVAYRNGAPVRLSDVATVADSVENNKNLGNFNGIPALTLAVQRQPGANTIAVADAVNAMLPQIQKQLPPAIHMTVGYDQSQSIRESVRDVQITLLLAALMVVAVIFVFLRTPTATFIPAVALPITVIGTFAGMALMNFSIDNLSLMALTLAVVFIVDDAIVMLENIMRHIEAGEDPLSASLIGSKEVSFTILSMTLSLASVFIPFLFMAGILGRLLHEFAIVIVMAILISGIVSVTLTPMLCSRIIKSREQESHTKHNAFYKFSEHAFDSLQSSYATSLHWAMTHRKTIFGVFLASLACTVFAFRVIPQDFLPSTDNGSMFGFTRGANGTSFLEMLRYQKQAEQVVLANPNVESLMSQAGAGLSNSYNNGQLRIKLKPRSERSASVDEVMQQLRGPLSRIPGIQVFLQNPPPIKIGGMQSRAAYQYTLQGLDVGVLQDASVRLQQALAATPPFIDVTSNFDASTPSITVAVNRDRAAALGVSVQQIETALGAAFGGQQISTIYTATDQFKVILEVQTKYQQDAESLSRLYLSGSNGALVPLSAVTTIGRGSTSVSQNHLSQVPAITLSFSLPPGVPLSEAITKINEVEQRVGIPDTVQRSFQGTAQAFQDSVQGMGLLILGAILAVYIVLGILYESFIHPLTILSGLPAAAVGALLTLGLFGIPLSLYAFVGMIMLIGLVKKNAIMMIDFALTRQRQDGRSAEDAIQEAAIVRFRPIMMTTMAALVGTLPIAFGYGAGGESRQPLGLAVVGGLLLSQTLTLYITPVLYCYLDAIGDRFTRKRSRPLPVSAE